MDKKELLDCLRDWVDLYFHEMNCSDKGLQETLEHNNLVYHEIIGIINASGEVEPQEVVELKLSDEDKSRRRNSFLFRHRGEAMNYNEAEIKLCRRLHELGARPDMREGDWITDEKYLNTPSLINADNAIFILNNAQKERKRYILLWTWERCREWLKEKRCWLLIHDDRVTGIYLTFWEGEINRVSKKYYGHGRTDLEAILAVMVQVAEEEKK